MSAARRRPPPRRPPQRRRPPPRPPRRPRSARSELAGRLIVAIPAAILAVLAIWTAPAAFLVLIAVVGLVAMHELYEMLESAHPVKIVGFLALLGALLAGHFGSERQILLVALLALPLTFVLHVARPPQGNVVGVVGSTLLGIYWIALPIGCAALLRDLPHGPGIITDILLGTFLGDAGAYFIGRAVGRRPLAPELSPNKTIEGLVGGVVVGVFAVWLAGLYQSWLSGVAAVVLGLAVALSGPIGDLFESAVKRAAGTKDSGHLFGAHGGALDRLDAVLFTAVAGYFVWRAFV